MCRDLRLRPLKGRPRGSSISRDTGGSSQPRKPTSPSAVSGRLVLGSRLRRAAARRFCSPRGSAASGLDRCRWLLCGPCPANFVELTVNGKTCQFRALKYRSLRRSLLPIQRSTSELAGIGRNCGDEEQRRQEVKLLRHFHNEHGKSQGCLEKGRKDCGRAHRSK